MTKDSLKKQLKETGIIGSMLYYGGRALPNIEMRLIGGWCSRHGKLNKNRLVLKNRQMQDFTDNTRAFFEYLIKNHYNEKYEIIWMVSRKRDFSHLHYKNVKFVTAENRYGWNSCRAYYYGATAGYFFYTNHTADLNRYACSGQTVINLWHGCGYKGAALENKNIPRSNTMGKFDYALVPGPVFVQTKSVYWQCPKEKILPLGYPRYDWMLDPSNRRDEIMQKLLGTDAKNKKLIIWMPTFRKSSLQGYAEGEIQLPYELPAVPGEETMDELDRLCGEAGVLLLIKKHPLQTGWEEKTKRFANIRYVTDEQFKKTDIPMYRLVGVCDGLISDYSSIAVDFMLLDRPLAFILTDYEEYKQKRGFVFENPLEYMPGDKIYDFEGLKAFIRNTGQGMDPYCEERRRLLPKMHNVSENYCARLADWLQITP